MKSIDTSIEIQAPVETVWRLLTDFSAHGAWDPLFASITGEPAIGAQLRVRFRQGSTVKPRITEVSPGRVLEWLGALPIPGLFAGRHRFELEPRDGTTRLRHIERFNGLLVPLLSGLLKKTEAGFVEFNKAIKRQAEAVSRG